MAILFLVFLYVNGEARYQSPFQKQYAFTSVSYVAENTNGDTYVIDGGRKTIVVLNQEHQLKRLIQGGAESKDFFYAGRSCADSRGNLYVADTISGEHGNLIEKERIIRVGARESVILWERAYEQDMAPLQYGNILDMQCYQDTVYFLIKEKEGLSLYCLAEDGAKQLLYTPCGYYISDGAYDAATGAIFVTTRTGEVCGYLPESEDWEVLRKADAESIPWGITAVAGEVYYTELRSKGIYHFSLAEPYIHNMCYQNAAVLYSLSLSEDGQTLTVTDNESFLYLDTKDYLAQPCGSVALGNRVKVVLFWLICVLIILAEAAIVLSLVAGAIRDMKDKSGLARVILVVISAISVAALASYSSVSVLMQNHDKTVIEHMQFFADNLRRQIDTGTLERINSLSDYHNEDYMELKNNMDSMIRDGYDNNICYYYVIYKTDGSSIDCIMDYEDTTACGQPIYPYGDNDYTSVFMTGESLTVSEISSYGSWMFTLLPITDDKGEVIAELEVGGSLDKEFLEKQALMRENIITVLCSCGVIVMLVIEGVFILSFFERRRDTPKEQWDITQQLSIRGMVFLSYMTDSMQDAFIAILCSKLYTDSLPISRELAIALPMSLQLMMAAVFSMLGGRLSGKLGVKRTMQLGLFSQMMGFLICMLVPGYMGILMGKVLIGIGLGIVYVTANTMASMGSTDAHVEAGFADVSAGVLSGVTIGVGLGSIILSLADYRMVYLIGAVFMGVGIMLTIPARNVKLVEAVSTEKTWDKMRIVRFLLSKRVLGFFALILIPFMMSLSYREYFFPIYVEQYGITEVQIGRIYLGCGMLVLYIGPYLAKTVLKTLGAKKSIILASLCMAGNMGLFVIYPNLYSVMAGMVILAVVISFAYTCQYTYFEGLEECNEVGMGNAMGIYSLFENLGQTIGPMVYGSALMLGNRLGIGVLFGLMTLVTIMFVFTAKQRGKAGECV